MCKWIDAALMCLVVYEMELYAYFFCGHHFNTRSGITLPLIYYKLLLMRNRMRNPKISINFNLDFMCFLINAYDFNMCLLRNGRRWMKWGGINQSSEMKWNIIKSVNSTEITDKLIYFHRIEIQFDLFGSVAQ